VRDRLSNDRFSGPDVAESRAEVTMATVSVDQRVDQLNSLLRGEISAVETYKQAIEERVGSGASFGIIRSNTKPRA
jgi:hypothetical protein